jgi:3-hydroxyacyl-[acyl-carrier-protein] dehydratase
MSRQQILDAIPHRPPMLLVDEVVEWESEHIVCKKTFQADEFFFQGHYPDYPLVPGVILCEAAMQAGAVLLSKHVAGNGVPVAGRLSDVKFKRMIRPGDTVLFDVTLDERMGDAFFLSAKVTCDGKLSVSLGFAVTLAKRET